MIDQGTVERVLAHALRTGGSFAEIFVEDRRSMSAGLEDGSVEKLSSSRDRGAGIRVISGDTTGFAHTADLSESGLLRAAETAAGAARGAGAGTVAGLNRVDATVRTHVSTPPESVTKDVKVGLLRRADDAARSAGADVRQVMAGYAEGRRSFLVANSDGVLASDEQVRTRFAVSVVASGDTGMQTGSRIAARTVGFELFDEVDVTQMARDAARTALVKLQARPAPTGSLPVVLAAGGGAVLFHEACGHPLEADLVAKGASVFRGRVGERVAMPGVTLVDDGTVSAEWGYFTVDDEGRPGQRNVLIDDGVLTGYMWDLRSGRKEERTSSGNGRRQTYKHLPIVRMSNTFLLAGSDDPDSIIGSTPHGVYVALLGGGQVNTATGDFVFGMREAYMIERGEITYPIRDANLIGNCAEVLERIDAVGTDFAMAPGGGMCGKDGQSAPVGMGQPTLRVTGMTIGGTSRG